jgi:hypothetical protein
MLKKTKGKIKRRNTEPSMLVSAPYTVHKPGASPVQASPHAAGATLSQATLFEDDGNLNNTNF